MKTVYSSEQIIRAEYITKIVGDSHNLLILYELMNFGEKSFNELKRMTNINSVTLSKKLTFLKKQGLIKCRGDGNENKYNVAKKSFEFRPIIVQIEKLITK